MNHKDRQKMCLGCDGRISMDAQECPYCGTTLEKTTEKEEAALLKQNQDHSTSLYPPPYSAKNVSPSNLDDKKQAQPMKQTSNFKGIVPEKRFVGSSPLGNPAMPTDGENEQHGTDTSSFWPLLLLSVGANLLMLGLLQLFFSDQGFLRLEWDSSYWFVYCLLAAPLFLLGFKKINQLK